MDERKRNTTDGQSSSGKKRRTEEKRSSQTIVDRPPSSRTRSRRKSAGRSSSKRSRLDSVTRTKSSDRRSLQHCFDNNYTTIEVNSKQELGELLGEGGFGKVYESCDVSGTGAPRKKRCGYAVKFQEYDPDDPDTRRRILGENELSNRLWNRYNIGPEYFGTWECPKKAVIATVLGRWDGELGEGERLPLPLVEKLEKQIRTMHNAGYAHNDILAKNVLVRRNARKQVTDVTIADFGLADFIIEPWDEEETQRFIDYYSRPRFRLRRYIKDSIGEENLLEHFSNRGAFDWVLVGWLRKNPPRRPRRKSR